jgi:hypothetical protein
MLPGLEELDRSTVERSRVHDHPHQGCFPGPIWTDQAFNGSFTKQEFLDIYDNST